MLTYAQTMPVLKGIGVLVLLNIMEYMVKRLLTILFIICIVLTFMTVCLNVSMRTLFHRRFKKDLIN